MEPVLPGIYLLLVGAFIGVVVYIIKDWFKSGRFEKGEYLTVLAFNEHRKECCAIGLKKEFTLCKQESCTNQAKTDGRLFSIEEKLRDGHETFQILNDKMDKKFDAFAEKFDRMNKALERIKTVLELDYERRDRGEQ
jgi:hypothetical protein